MRQDRRPGHGEKRRTTTGDDRTGVSSLSAARDGRQAGPGVGGSRRSRLPLAWNPTVNVCLRPPGAAEQPGTYTWAQAGHDSSPDGEGRGTWGPGVHGSTVKGTGWLREDERVRVHAQSSTCTVR